MFAIQVRFDTKEAVDKLNRIQQGIGDRALISALNKTAAQAKTQFIRAISQEYNLTSGFVRERIGVTRAKKAGINTFTAALLGNPSGANKRSMNVIHFVEKSVSIAEARRRRKSGTLTELRFKIKLQGGKSTIAGAFIGNKGRTVFRRIGKARLPIEPVQTIGVPQMFSAKKINIPIQQWILANFPRIFDSDMKYFLSTVK